MMSMNQKPGTRNFLSASLLAFVVLLANGCYYDKEALLYPGSGQVVDCTTISAKFGADVSPLISSKCATSGCHDATASGGLIFQNYAQISSAKDRINTRAVIEKTMPSAAPLQPAEINILKCWIESGAPNN
jgi:uncharacterized membrane protein